MQGLRTSLLNKLVMWFKDNPILGFTLILLAVCLMVGTAGYLLLSQPQPTKQAQKVTKKSTPTPSPPEYFSPLTGVKVTDEASTKLAVTGIMIENSLAARPQSGLKAAGVVFEAIAEGGITRFLALYQESKPQIIGPVRSLRLYDVDWFAPFQASIAHVGGSLSALKEVRNGTYRDIDQFFNSPSYWRATDRYSPHNVYTSFERLDALNNAKGYTTSSFVSWPRQTVKTAQTINASNISVHISGPLYDSQYTYDPVTNIYTRSQAGEQHIDREAGTIQPSVLVIMDTTMEKVFEDGYREQITTTGSGKVRVFQNGAIVEGTWNKADRNSQIKFIDSSGKEIIFNRGQTWIIAIPANQGGNVSWQ